ncbi:unnamed protein product [Allacma fusca]|uniref:Uncharacterized protein n=1 Tax=Allacma fusca TaxID=39272 RepID=A0A8J2K1F9_9HEXA|nr:unnamed protein product [Allacma fusca]
MTNLLDSVLTDPQYYLWSDSKISGPSKVDEGFSEAFSFKGHSSYCFVLCSFAISRDLRFSCTIEIVNCLSVPLRNRNRWYCNSENNTFLSMEILPLHRESFFASDQTNLKVMISYEIISTDLNLVIGLKLGPGGKSFAAAFVRFPVVTGKKKLEKLMDENQWKIHDYKTILKASEGMKLIAIRNIRAEICMTDEERSVLKIRIFAV